ncbi:unnamed protein product [Amoebophrya sp. A120]|nr:unnamed protein product [Amoebophrya sp. A120]|eukprot:GSA120T00013341001.1
MMSVRSRLLFGIFCLTGPSLAAVAGPLDLDDPVVAHVCSFLAEFPLHAIFDAVLTGPPASGRGPSASGNNWLTLAKDRELYEKGERLKEHSWKRFCHLLLYPGQQAGPIRGASRLFRGSVVASTLPEMGFATQLLSYVEPENLRTNADSRTKINYKKPAQTLDDSFRYFLHLLENALREPGPQAQPLFIQPSVEPLRPRWNPAYAYPRVRPPGYNIDDVDPMNNVFLLLDLPGRRYGDGFGRFRIFTKRVRLSHEDLDKLAGWKWNEDNIVLLPSAPSLVVCGRIRGGGPGQENLFSLALDIQQRTNQATWSC